MNRHELRAIGESRFDLDVGNHLRHPFHHVVAREKRGAVVHDFGDRPVQVGSHFHFYEVNAALKFEREKARGFRLNIAAGTAVRFEPGQERTVELVALAGDRHVYGFNGLVMGPL